MKCPECGSDGELTERIDGVEWWCCSDVLYCGHEWKWDEDDEMNIENLDMVDLLIGEGR